jgi:hypothetical protein
MMWPIGHFSESAGMFDLNARQSGRPPTTPQALPGQPGATPRYSRKIANSSRDPCLFRR